MKQLVQILLLFASAIPLLAAGEASAPATCAFDGAVLALRKTQIAAGATQFADDVRKLRADADKALRAPIVTLIEGKKHIAPGGNPHDYVSIATYYWPNPATSNGLPYIQKDGVKNPAKDEYDEGRLMEMCGAVRRLALAWYLTGETKYAERATVQLRAWFFDEKTRMNPNLEHAQMKLGSNEGSGTGIIDSRNLTDVVDAAYLLRGASAWTDADEQKLKDWFRAYYTWLTTSKNGRNEDNTTNNHAVWYDVQAVAIAQFIGDEAAARDRLEAAKTRRIAKQIEPDGAMPRELGRTLSVTYSIFNLQAFFRLAQLGQNAGVDLWHFKTDDGRCLRAALDYMIPFATGQKTWERQQIKEAKFSGLHPLLHQAARVWNEPAYEKTLTDLDHGKGEGEARKLDFLQPPPSAQTR